MEKGLLRRAFFAGHSIGYDTPPAGSPDAGPQWEKFKKLAGSTWDDIECIKESELEALKAKLERYKVALTSIAGDDDIEPEDYARIAGEALYDED